jgi:predicted peptidase
MGTQQARSFKKRITRTVGLRYLLSLPDGYDPNGTRRWPLLLFLHGAGERGDDLELVKKHGIPKILEAGTVADFPFIAISPQCPTDSWWNMQVDALSALLDEMEKTLLVDSERIYVTGLSMGGFGTWALAIAEPHRFAAIAPVCGGGDPRGVRRIPHLPAWVFHGARDETVPLMRSAEMVEALARSGGYARFTVYPEAKHDSWTETYDNPEVYAWLLSHTRAPAPSP